MNPKHRMELLERNDLDRVLCVAVDNSPIVGTFFTDPGQQPRAIFERDDIREEPRFLADERGVLSAESSASHYLPGDPIFAALVQNGGERRSFLGGRWMVTQGRGNVDGSCRLSEAVRFEEGLEEDVVCRLRGPIDRDWCTAMAPQRFSTFLRVAEHPAVSLSGDSGWVEVSLESARKVSFATGATSAVSPSSLLDTDPDAAGRFAGGSCACSDAVVAAEYTVRTTGDGTIAAVEASLVVADVEGCSDPSVPLRTRVRFEPTEARRDQMERSVERNNLVPRERSGHPGYLVGQSVLAGIVVSSEGDEAIGMFQDGLQVRMANVDGSCPDTAASDPGARHMTVPFGEAVTVSCIETLDANGLEDACSEGDTLPPFLQINATRIGILGNADPLQTGQSVAFLQWRELERDEIDAAPSFESRRRTCEGLITGIHVQLLAANVGEVGNPQRKIVAARLSPVEGTWSLPPPFAGRSTGHFERRIVVSYFELEDGALEEFVPSPPSVVRLPHDLFHPFQIDDGGARTSGAGATGAAGWIAGVAAVVGVRAMLQL